MSLLAYQRCVNHAQREAAARCPECKRYFCRECVTEHEDRMLCVACLAAQARPSLSRRLRLRGIGRFLQFTLGFIILWLVFYGCGRLLLMIPSEYHENVLLRGQGMEE